MVKTGGTWPGSPYSIGTLANGEVITILIRGIVSLTATGTIINQAIVASSTIDPNTSNNVSIVATSIGDEPPSSADLSIIKTQDLDIIDAGNVLTYTLVIANNGPDDAQDVMLIDAIVTRLLAPKFSLDDRRHLERLDWKLSAWNSNRW